MQTNELIIDDQCGTIERIRCDCNDEYDTSFVSAPRNQMNRKQTKIFSKEFNIYASVPFYRTVLFVRYTFRTVDRAHRTKFYGAMVCQQAMRVEYCVKQKKPLMWRSLIRCHILSITPQSIGQKNCYQYFFSNRFTFHVPKMVC